MPQLVMGRPSSPAIYKKRFDKFSGVDFSTDALSVSDGRSPNAKNIISDAGGHPEKRVGYRCLSKFDAQINGIFAFKDNFIIHAGDKMYKLAGEEKEKLLDGVNDAKSFGIIFRDKLYILTGREFLYYDGEELGHVHDIATAPQVLSQANEHLEGESYQPFNLLTRRRKVGFTINGGRLEITFLVAEDEINPDDVKFYYRATNKEVIPDEAGFYKNLYYPGQPNDVTDAWQFRFTTTEWEQIGPDALICEYELLNDELRNKNRAIIEKCTFAAVYENRLFVGGNPDYPNTDFYSELNDAAYFSDISYTGVGTSDETPDEEAVSEREKTTVGSGGTKILGYSYVGNYLAIHKNGDELGASIYLRSAQLTDSGAIFPITEGINGEGIVSPHTCANLIDDPLFVTPSGVYAIASSDIIYERCIQPRSTRINARLSRELNLENAVSCACDGFFYVFINGNVYVADARQKTYARNISNAYEYEWYFWDNIPARCVLSHEKTVYFGCADGRFCRFNTDLLTPRGEALGTAYSDDGEPIAAEWSTAMWDDGDFYTYKTIKRRGSGVYVKSTSAPGRLSVLIRTERDFGEENASAVSGTFSFENIDFENFTFNTQGHSFIDFGKKVKDFRMMQIICRNDTLNQPLGVYAAEIRFTKGYFAKER